MTRRAVPRSVRALVDRASSATRVKTHRLVGPQQDRGSCFVRWAVWHVAYRRRPNQTALGRLFGRDHSTVGYGLRQAERLRETDISFDTLVRLLEEHVR